MLRHFRIPAFVLLIVALPLLAAEARAASDPRAIEVADRVMSALGGKARWDSLPGLRWAFGVMVNDTMRGAMRRHAWDKHTGWHRVDGMDRQGNNYVFIHKVGSTEGMAWIAGKKMEGDTLTALLKRAQSLWTNDTYWLLMPYKLRDPGVNLGYDGEAVENGVTYDKLALTFDKVGETPGDRYWVYVNRANNRVEIWEHILQGQPPPAVRWTWEKWEQDGGLWFPSYHNGAENRSVCTLYAKAVTKFNDTEFTAP
jgi:hypothetical protein